MIYIYEEHVQSYDYDDEGIIIQVVGKEIIQIDWEVARRIASCYHSHRGD